MFFNYYTQLKVFFFEMIGLNKYLKSLLKTPRHSIHCLPVFSIKYEMNSCNSYSKQLTVAAGKIRQCCTGPCDCTIRPS